MLLSPAGNKDDGCMAGGSLVPKDGAGPPNETEPAPTLHHQLRVSQDYFVPNRAHNHCESTVNPKLNS